MKKTLVNIKNNIKFVFKRIISVFKFSLKKKDKPITLLILFSSVLLLSVAFIFPVATISYSPTNKSQSIAEVINSQNTEYKYGILNFYETSNNTFEYVSIDAEKTKKIRSIYTELEIYDAYLTTEDSFPAEISINGKETKAINFLLQPKENYTNSFFNSIYSFKLLCGKTSKDSNTEDIYITKTYADKLLDSLFIENYEGLIGEKIELGYKHKYLSNSIMMTYKIKGVIDENDEHYLKMKNYIGDFFLVNQYLSLPINPTVLFGLEKDTEALRKELDTIFRTYKYDTSGRHFDALNFAYDYDTRIYAISNLNSEYQYLNTSSASFQKYNSLYEYFFNKQYIILIIITIILNLIFLVLGSMLLFVFLNKTKFLKQRKTVIISFLFIISIAVSLSILLSKLYKMLFFKNLPLSINCWGGFVLLASEAIIIIFVYIKIYLLKLKKNENKKI